MKFSFWTQVWNYSEKIPGNDAIIFNHLVEYYTNSSKSFTLIHKKENSVKFSRGWKWFSLLGIGSEKWAYHVVEVTVTEINDFVQVDWNINLKLFGLQVAKNAIVEECKDLIRVALKNQNNP